MEEVFGIKSDINSVIKMTKQFLLVLEQINSKNPKMSLNPNYVNLLYQVFQSPDVMMYMGGK